jgi:hypothetical protein
VLTVCSDDMAQLTVNGYGVPDPYRRIQTEMLCRGAGSTSLPVTQHPLTWDRSTGICRKLSVSLDGVASFMRSSKGNVLPRLIRVNVGALPELRYSLLAPSSELRGTNWRGFWVMNFGVKTIWPPGDSRSINR